MKVLTHSIPSPLFILEMANNHMGRVDHGIRVIREFGEVCKNFPFRFAFKLQYRELDTFIHPSMKNRMDLKYIKRFSETHLSRMEFDKLIEEIRANDFIAVCTPFDESSVDVIEQQNLDVIKIASCSFTDWPLLERVVQTDKPIIASTAGSTLKQIDQVISFLQHRQKDFAIMHCVGEYPTPDEKMHLSQINLLRKRYPDVRIGFSSHEDPNNTDMVKVAVAKGVDLFEKHVGVPSSEFNLNAYSCSPSQYESFLEAAEYIWTICGEGKKRLPVNEKEQASLRSLRRGVYARRRINLGEFISANDVYFAFPPQENQISANEWSKYADCRSIQEIDQDGCLNRENCEFTNTREQVLAIVERVKNFLEGTKVVIPGSADLEISHHLGLERFSEVGLTMITVVNRDYCKKLLVCLPGQEHPEQFHRQKEETFHIIHGEVELTLDGASKTYCPGDVITIEPETRHAFRSATGAVIEEISSTHFKNDSFYTDSGIMENKQRKTMLTYWMSA